MANTMKITLVKSLVGQTERQRATAYALGLRKKDQTREVVDNEAVRGMVNKISYLLKIEG
jgi:large subunit ribosomal protein L30